MTCMEQLISYIDYLLHKLDGHKCEEKHIINKHMVIWEYIIRLNLRSK